MQRTPARVDWSAIGSDWPFARRLLAPLTLLVLAVGCATTYFVLRTISLRMDRAADARLEELAEALQASSFALDDELLSRVRAVTAAEVIIVSPQGQVVAATLPRERARALAAGIGGAVGPHFVSVQGERHRIVTRDLGFGENGTSVRLAVAASTRPTEQLKRELAWVIVIAMGAGLALLIVLVHRIVRSATRPLDRLADVARDAGRGDLERRAPAGGGREIEILAREFNSMLARLAQSRAELVRVERLAAAGRMAAGVAHEIRNPLSSIRMNVQLLAGRDDVAPPVRDELREVIVEVDRLELVLANLLDLTVARRFEPALRDVGPVVDGVLRLTSRRLEHLKIAVETDWTDDLPKIRLDEPKARRAFLNVILNAAEAMPGGGRLRIATKLVGQAVEVAFEDTGKGIDPSALAQAFEPFSTSKTNGTGLGLPIVRSIVEVHGGRMRIEPRPSQGTRCVLEFPVCAEAPCAAEIADGKGAG